jgi:hypothetical protein
MFRIWVWGFELWVLGFGFGVPGLGFRVERGFSTAGGAAGVFQGSRFRG